MRARKQFNNEIRTQSHDKAQSTRQSLVGVGHIAHDLFLRSERGALRIRPIHRCEAEPQTPSWSGRLLRHWMSSTKQRFFPLPAGTRAEAKRGGSSGS